MNRVTYTLTRSRRKTLAIHIKPDGAVEVRAPLRLAKFEIDRFVTAKTAWILKNQERIAAEQSAAPSDLPRPRYDKDEFVKTVGELIEKWERRLNVHTTFIGIRAMTSRWGSCTARTRRIRLNAALAYCSFDCLEYVVVHELAHLLESNHSPRFWAVVAEALPDYKERRKALKTFSWLLTK